MGGRESQPAGAPPTPTGRGPAHTAFSPVCCTRVRFSSGGLVLLLASAPQPSHLPGLNIAAKESHGPRPHPGGRGHRAGLRTRSPGLPAQPDRKPRATLQIVAVSSWCPASLSAFRTFGVFSLFSPPSHLPDASRLVHTVRPPHPAPGMVVPSPARWGASRPVLRPGLPASALPTHS